MTVHATRVQATSDRTRATNARQVTIHTATGDLHATEITVDGECGKKIKINIRIDKNAVNTDRNKREGKKRKKKQNV